MGNWEYAEVIISLDAAAATVTHAIYHSGGTVDKRTWTGNEWPSPASVYTSFGGEGWEMVAAAVLPYGAFEKAWFKRPIESDIAP
jgi:hypothetical protein